MMRNLLTIALLATGLIGAATGQESLEQAKLQIHAQRNYLASLESEHECIRNSAVFRVMQYRARFPQVDLQPFVKALREMSEKDSSPQNRLYAFLACTFLENGQLLQAAGAPPKQEDEKHTYFLRLQGLMQGNHALARE